MIWAWGVLGSESRWTEISASAFDPRSINLAGHDITRVMRLALLRR